MKQDHPISEFARAMQSVPLRPADASEIAAIAKKHSGITSGENQPEFLRTRLSKRLLALGLHSYTDYVSYLKGPNGRAEAILLVEALATHTTSFFREPAHFDWLNDTGLPALTQGERRRANLAVWSAAASTGAELWSCGMVIEEYLRTSGINVNYQLFGTDVSRAVLSQGALAVFSEREIANIPEELRKNYLLRSKKVVREGKPVYRIVPKLRQKAKLAYANLLDPDSTELSTPMDIVFLRNVLIYFTPEDQKKVVQGVVRRMRPGGYLFVAHTETVRGLVDGLFSVGNSIYQYEAPDG
ncbi:CheR family methyltransferase [Roseobacter weihaiensis]|uniref:CheR family methyltransferase n=1 Tax=Roseobacter weihaiensis TaxID=2763262 RepID=UPI001D09FC9B|nr:CheR family methyltransferase [Roseobacter sp. H9]